MQMRTFPFDIYSFAGLYYRTPITTVLTIDVGRREEGVVHGALLRLL